MTPTTLQDVLKPLAWSLNVMLTGCHPNADWLDRPLEAQHGYLAGGYRGVLTQLRGDWQFFVEALGVPQWNCLDAMCWMCKATGCGDAFGFNDFSAHAPWRASRWTHEAYIDHLVHRGLSVPVLLSMVVGVRLDCLTIDILHAVDQGVAAHIIGNVIFIFALVRGCFGGMNYKEKLELLNDHLTKWYNATKCENRLKGKITQDRLR
eukprot:2314487-Pyramimonas_sp.AAC.1